MFNYLITFAYNGKNYSGWQIQNHAITIEEVLTENVSKVVGEKVILFASGRTDAGVSALGQTANFFTTNKLDIDKVVMHINHYLPKDISVLNIQSVPNEFHARYSVKKKTYSYYFYINKKSLPFYDQFATRFFDEADMNIFKKNVDMLIGTYDFTSFCAVNTDKKDKTRTIYEAKLSEINGLYKFTITGDGFLYNMVRIIMGTLIHISCGKLEGDILQIIQKKDRLSAGMTASSVGLILESVEY